MKFWAKSRDCEWVYKYDSESVILRIVIGVKGLSLIVDFLRKKSYKRWNVKLIIIILAKIDLDNQEFIKELDQAYKAIKVLKERYYGNIKRPIIIKRYL